MEVGEGEGRGGWTMDNGGRVGNEEEDEGEHAGRKDGAEEAGSSKKEAKGKEMQR